jgi:hypothetical protein
MFLRVFLIVGFVAGVVVHVVTREPMPWWPDTAIMGAFFAAIAALGTLQYRRGKLRMPQLVVSAAITGAFFLLAGLVGYDVNRHAAFRRGTSWTGAPIAWEIVLGVSLLVVAVVVWRRLARWITVRASSSRAPKPVGHGRSSGAVHASGRIRD